MYLFMLLDYLCHMKSFFTKFIFFATPIIFLLIGVIYADIFQIFGFKEDYYTNTFISVNRGMITTKTYNNLRLEEKYNSFIFGSSRSHAFHCKKWAEHINNAKPLHFDANSENILGITNKITYIDETGNRINNALLILDRETLSTTQINKGHLFIPMPCVSKQSKWEYYQTFIQASLSFRFLFAYIDYSFFKTYRTYMKSYIDTSGDYGVFKTADLIYGQEKLIKKDSIGYYNNLLEQEVFYDRSDVHHFECHVTDKEVNLLQQIKKIFDKHQTQYKIVISPTYDQIPLEKNQLNLLQDLFGKENISDFSGKNEFTENIGNYYESSHYKPFVANKILELIYK